MHVSFRSASTLSCVDKKGGGKTINPGYVSMPKFYDYSELSFGLSGQSLWDGLELLSCSS